MSYTFEFPVQYFPDPALFGDVGLGELYVGVPDGNPATTPADRIQVYLSRQGLTDLAISQPIELSAGGVPLYNGSPATLKVLVPYSVAVLDYLGAQIYYSALAGSEISEFIEIDNRLDIIEADIVELEASKISTVDVFASLATTTAFLGKIVYLTCHTSGRFGAGHFKAVSSSGLTPDSGTISTSATAGLFWQRIYSGYTVDITWFGVIPDDAGVPYDSTAIQQAVWSNINFRGIYYPSGRYGVTKITQINTSLEIVYGDNAQWFGLADTATSCMFELKVGNGFVMYGIKLNGRQNTNYVCGMHWYTNNLTAYYPGKADLNIAINEFLIGLVIGMLPSQTTYYFQGDIVADGIATDAPLSECKTRFRITDCPAGMLMAQPNGKITLTDSYIEATAQAWELATRPAVSTWKALRFERYGEITMSGGFLEALTTFGGSTEGTLIEMNGGNLQIDNVVFESIHPIRLRGNYFTLRMSKLANYGFNSLTRPMFIIDAASTGTVEINNSWMTFPYTNQTGGTAYLAKGVSSIITETYAEAPNVLISLNQVELRHCYGPTGGGWEMPCVGVKTKFNNVRFSSFAIVGPVEDNIIKRLSDAKLSNSSTNLLAPLIDNSNSTITAYPVIVPSATGGWTFTSGGGVYSYGRQAPSATLNLESLNLTAQTPPWVLRMQANGGVALTASSPSFNCEAYSYIYVTGWVYVGAGGAAPAGIKVESRDFADALLSTQNLVVGAVNALPSGWAPFTCWGQQVGGGSKMRVLLYVESGCDLQFYGISAYVDK